MTAGPSPAALAPAQFEAALWADDDSRVDALLLAPRLPGLAERLRAAQQAGEIEDHQCLWPGAQPPERLAQAPFLARLRPATPFTAWLLGAAGAGLPDWGLLLHSGRSLSFLALRSHARALCQATLADGQAIELDWMDPQILRELLPLAPPEQLDQLFAPLQALLWPEGRDWVRHTLPQGRLQSQRLTLIA
jgi:hypothetical protein